MLGSASATVEACEPARGIRACRREDLPGVAALYESLMRSGRREPPPRLADYFERTFFDCPWADAEIPSLLYEDDGGRIVGFIGLHIRRLRVDGRRVRIAYGGQFVVDPQVRNKAVGAMLFRAHLWGPQDATLADGANDMVRRMWEISGGEVAHLKSMTWTRMLRPFRCASDYALRKLRRPSLAQRLRPLWRPLDELAARVAGPRLVPGTPAMTSEPLTPHGVLENLGAVTEGLRLHPDYDEEFLDWLFREMDALESRGRLVRALLRSPEGEFIGWYVYYLVDGFSQVLQVAARRGAAGEVLDHLLHHAHANGAAAVSGRLEPQLLEPLARRHSLFGWAGTTLIHSRNPALLGALLSGRAWLARMDGEAWMGHHKETFS